MSELSPSISTVQIADEHHEQERPPRQLRKWLAFFLLGLVNNLGYVVVNAAAQSLANSFYVPNLIGAVPWANIAFGFVARGMGAFLLRYTSYSSYGWRIVANGLFMVAGIVGVAFAPSFFFALVAVCIVGLSSSFGESVLIGYLRFFKSELVNAWASGTGAAGVTGTLLYILFGFLGLNDRQSFLVTMPTVLLYWAAFFVVLEPPAVAEEPESPKPLAQVLDSDKPGLSELSGPSEPAQQGKQGKQGKQPGRQSKQRRRRSLDGTALSESQSLLGAEEVENEHDGGNYNSLSSDPSRSSLTSSLTSAPLSEPLSHSETTAQRYWRCTKLVWWISLQLALVYVFEYIISAGAASKVVTQDELKSSNFFYAQSYAIFGLCYQIGVFISRSSLQVVKIKRVEILTVLQGLNLVIWIIDDAYKFISIYALFPMMIFVGLLGGASYVNVFHIALSDTSIPEKDRELCINLVAVAITLGITLGCSCILVFDNTFLADA